MTLNCRRRRDWKITRRVIRLTLNGRDMAPRDVFYVDTRRGVVRGYVRDALGSHVVRPDRTGIQTFERRGKVRVWTRAA